MSKNLVMKWPTVAGIAILGVLVLGLELAGRLDAQPGPPSGSATHQEILQAIKNLEAQINETPTDTRKKYFLSTTTTNGNIPAGFCGTGFHMASVWEIFDTSSLKYDTTLGLTKDDTGDGPPSDTMGWARTGYGSQLGSVAGVANCAAWTNSNGFPAHGTTVALYPNDQAQPPKQIVPWFPAASTCNATHRVWCVED
jgi:hypothetical protein